MQTAIPSLKGIFASFLYILARLLLQDLKQASITEYNCSSKLSGNSVLVFSLYSLFNLSKNNFNSSIVNVDFLSFKIFLCVHKFLNQYYKSF